MKLLLDTCAVLWLAAEPGRLSAPARQAISDHPSALFVSAISAFEIALKHHKRRLDLGLEPVEWWARAVAHHGLRVLPVTDDIALASTALPPLHADPCDRIVIATAIQQDMQIVTVDALIRQYPLVTVVW